MVNKSANLEDATPRSAATRQAIMATAERLYAQHGLSAVSNRQIGEAAGQNNTTVVSYHFGSKTTLVREIMTKHSKAIDAIRQRHVSAASASDDVRDWVRCLVRPVTEHLESLGVPSWHARFAVLVLTDPMMRAMITDDSLTRPSLQHTLRELGNCLKDKVSAQVRRERGEMARHVITHTCAERERMLAEGTARPVAAWKHTARTLEDALTGLLTAEVSHR
ncbi:TetR/AcrR family transcriptional regulator [Amycolatopsis rubida]|uniref:Regulatory protein, tetR family n=1 Tax=Amycolatopsis rubida TaxID=112413 RepID=A0A1I5HQ11_9PSEU|nr:TetR/AcrR family transcriptional regulator [Amycolatopsis rubida]SFO50404.1 regulatory protein, tetR family [Amycolatopsis rubida]